jgi:4-alpha-glucanotransferase
MSTSDTNLIEDISHQMGNQRIVSTTTTMDDDEEEEEEEEESNDDGVSLLRKEMTVKFRVKYYTKWGENLVVCGPSDAFGNWDAAKGLWMTCEHVKGFSGFNRSSAIGGREDFDDDDEDEENDEGNDGREEARDELLWTATKTLAWDCSIEYRYAVVDAHGEVIVWDSARRVARLRDEKMQRVVMAGNVVEFSDTFERRNHFEQLFSKRAFADVVLDKICYDDNYNNNNSSSNRAQMKQSSSSSLTMFAEPQPCEFMRSGVLDTNRINNNSTTSTSADLRVVLLRFQIKALRMPSKRPGSKVSVRVTGSCQSLGRWDRTRAMKMGNTERFESSKDKNDDTDDDTDDDRGFYWHLEVACASNELPVRYKYEIWDDDIDCVIESEEKKRAVGIDWDLNKRQFEEERRRKNNDNVVDDDDDDDADDDKNEETDEKTSSRSTKNKRNTQSGSLYSSYEAPKCILVSDGHFAHAKQFRCAGVAVPVFSLRSSKSLGCGEFLDLKNMGDFCRESGFRILQLLPVNDTRVHGMWWDSYPYSSLSVHALHPMYLRVTELGDDLVFPGSEEMKKFIESKRRELQELKEVDYEETLRVKMLIARKLHKHFLASFDNSIIISSGSSKKAALEREDFERFVNENREWLKPYAIFCTLSEIFQTTEHWLWGQLAKFDEKLVEKLADPEASPVYLEGVHFVYYLQWRLHVQLKEASMYLKQFGIALKGDLPIGVDKRSVDVWRKPELFRFYTNTGAPPDQFDKNGQNWKFPTYDWEKMRRDGNYNWWRSRLHSMEKYFSLVRVDHILGFFRIWELPAHCESGIMGRFRPSVPISRQELEACGLWDIDRLTIPRADASDLEFFFGKKAAEVAARFFNENELFPVNSTAADTAKECFGGFISNDINEESSFTKQLHNKFWTFKREFSTEVQILKCDQLKIRDGSPDWLVAETNEIKKGLLELTRNVCLLRSAFDPTNSATFEFDKDAFYPRFDMDRTRLFQKLESWQRSALSRISHEHYTTRQRFLWTQNAHKTIPAITNSTNMLVCGEDLGLVPDFVPGEMQNLGILGLRIQRMPPPGQEADANSEFGLPSKYPYDTVCSPSCHDTTTFRAWFDEDQNRSRKYYSQILGQEVSTTPKRCTAETMRKVVKQHLESPSALAIFALADILAMDEKYVNERDPKEETINDPTNSRHYWRFRFHINLEDMKKNDKLKSDLKKMVFESGRDVPK